MYAANCHSFHSLTKRIFEVLAQRNSLFSQATAGRTVRESFVVIPNILISGPKISSHVGWMLKILEYFPKTKVIQWNPNLCKYFIPDGQFSNLLLSRVSLSWDCEYESWLWFVLRQPNEKLRPETSRGREEWWGTISGGGGGETRDLQHLTVEAKFTNCFSVGIVLLLTIDLERAATHSQMNSHCSHFYWLWRFWGGPTMGLFNLLRIMFHNIWWLSLSKLIIYHSTCIGYLLERASMSVQFIVL